ncbi:phosphopantothenoylcysteine decarboxylase/phosphopantothenate--cysteine ligase [Candidatus Methanoperedens nitroreducens]|uniref:Coenzyme A biosynthesis bifunctional protein CoaBC n=1 Tax=Candidatus Methanoperedens nitratireducens TaxID=1392998 RepID=A0A062V9Z8_9EURY|nr:bifunctional phosphopantothenoylcysteine decarboxylase/phosphopantothenate--cysteine ligase CoaBC [Candidatus Methanoperedens nitroreducens]KCZ73343.1 phosphopantothenoylcysteine decarboxylase/phosphopantothenate--cysteine ligase [Candidatus Methanoperedens nitroreducens]MDJ1422709.1 bifunctional phosphopantothenoylcysteine decarboxylase/phosphopantothenate--cysteine ligase CoaBC [Candidatus Methanoperedens sp.]
MISRITRSSKSLEGKTIVLGITGSIAAVRCVELARELGRHGADVHAVMTHAAMGIIHPEAMRYATGKRVITEITGDVEHVEFCGINGRAHLLLIAPCTANTIGKLAHGIDDTSVTTFATTAFGSGVPVMVVPAMHESMYDHPIVAENIKKLRELGVEFIMPVMEEGAAKIAGEDEIVLRVERILGGKTLSGKRILITGGATAEAIDPIRILTNRASGRTGIELALEAFRKGADVTLVHRGRTGIRGIREFNIQSAQEMTDTVLEELSKGYELLISAAAISDFTLTSSRSKIKSDKEITLTLRPAPKLIKEARLRYPELRIIGFKAETGVTADELIKRGRESMESAGLDMVVANDVSSGGMGTEGNDVYIIDEGVKRVSGTKHEIAIALMDKIEEIF